MPLPSGVQLLLPLHYVASRFIPHTASWMMNTGVLEDRLVKRQPLDRVNGQDTLLNAELTISRLTSFSKPVNCGNALMSLWVLGLFAVSAALCWQFGARNVSQNGGITLVFFMLCMLIVVFLTIRKAVKRRITGYHQFQQHLMSVAHEDLMQATRSPELSRMERRAVTRCIKARFPLSVITKI